MADEKIVIFHHDCEGAVNHWSIVGELVRCKDCKHRPYVDPIWGDKREPDRDWTCPLICKGDDVYTRIPEDDFYCGDGERKESEE